MGMFKEELLKIFRRKQYIISFFVMCIAAIGYYVCICQRVYGWDLSMVRPAYINNVIYAEQLAFPQQFFVMLLPIVVCIATADIYFEEYKKGISNYIFLRTSSIKNLLSKLAAIVIATVILVAIPLALNMILTLITFPIQGAYTNTETYLSFVVKNELQFEELLVKEPYINFLVYSLIRIMTAVCYVVFAFGFSTLYTENRYIILLSGVLYYYAFQILGLLFPNDIFRINIYNTNGANQSILGTLIFICTGIVLGIVMTIIGSKREL